MKKPSVTLVEKEFAPGEVLQVVATDRMHVLINTEYAPEMVEEAVARTIQTVALLTEQPVDDILAHVRSCIEPKEPMN